MSAPETTRGAGHGDAVKTVDIYQQHTQAVRQSRTVCDFIATTSIRLHKSGSIYDQLDR